MFGFDAIDLDGNGSMGVGLQEKKGLFASNVMRMKLLKYRDESGRERSKIQVTITNYKGEVLNQYEI